MKPRTAVIGLGLFGREVAVSLARRGHSVLAIDFDIEQVEQIKDSVDQASAMDTTDEVALREARIDEMETVVCAIGAQHIENSILTTALLHQLEVPRIISRAADSLHARILRQVGATEVVNPEQEMGWRVANQIASPGIREVLRLAEDICVAEIPVPSSFVGETPASLDVRQKYGVTIIGVQRLVPAGERDVRTGATEVEGAGGRPLERNRRLILTIEPNDPFQQDDTLVVIGHEENMKRLSGLG
jgi:trk system potassium uptake protein TrkA